MTAKEIKQEVWDRWQIINPYANSFELNLLYDFIIDYVKIFCMKQREICYKEALIIFNDKIVNDNQLTPLSSDLRNILNAKFPEFYEKGKEK